MKRFESAKRYVTRARLRHHLRVLLRCGAWLWVGACDTDSSRDGLGEVEAPSRFLAQCPETDCADGLICLQTACARFCNDDDDCAALPGAPKCLGAGDFSFCQLECKTNEDCEVPLRHPGLACEGGRCSVLPVCELEGRQYRYGDVLTHCDDSCCLDYVCRYGWRDGPGSPDGCPRPEVDAGNDSEPTSTEITAPTQGEPGPAIPRSAERIYECEPAKTEGFRAAEPAFVPDAG